MSNVLGYFKHKSDTVLDGYTVMIIIDDGFEALTCYTPFEQHCTVQREYFEECEPITKEEYIKAANGFYTPSDYLI